MGTHEFGWAERRVRVRGASRERRGGERESHIITIML